MVFGAPIDQTWQMSADCNEDDRSDIRWRWAMALDFGDDVGELVKSLAARIVINLDAARRACAAEPDRRVAEGRCKALRSLEAA
jgi:hypothetical protein